MYLIPNCRSLLSSVATLQAYSGKSRLTKSKISDLFKLCLTHCSRSAFNSSSSFQLLLAILAIKLTTVLPLFRFWNSDNFRFDSAGPRAPNSFYIIFRDDSAGPRAELILIFFVMITVGQGSKIKNKNCFTELQSKITITFEIEILLNLQSKIKIKDI